MNALIIRQSTQPLPYQPVWQAMCLAVDRPDRQEQLWLLQHEPVFTLGKAGRYEHLLSPGHIPVVSCDRGGQVTYHGPGQLMIYTLFDLNRLGVNTRHFVRTLEGCIIRYLATLKITAHYKVEAPGVYVADQKICSIGIRIRNNMSYHGLALNVDMDLSPFSLINPCGFPDLKMSQMTEHTTTSMDKVILGVIPVFMEAFGFQTAIHGPTIEVNRDECVSTA